MSSPRSGSSRGAPPGVQIPLRQRPWGLVLGLALHAGLAAGLGGMALAHRVSVLAALGVPHASGPTRILLAVAALGFALLALNAALMLQSLRALGAPAVTFSPEHLTVPVARFLRGMALVRLSWREVRDVSLCSTSWREVVEIETTSGVTLTLPGALYPRTWRAPRIAEAIQQEAARR